VQDTITYSLCDFRKLIDFLLKPVSPWWGMTSLGLEISIRLACELIFHNRKTMLTKNSALAYGVIK
jgi:hypothetical protein